MNLNLESTKRFLKGFRFAELFTQELGWDKLRLQPRKLAVGDDTFTLTPIAEKRGFQIFECASTGEIPPRATRMKIDREVTKQAFEHLIVFVDGARQSQIWRWEQRDEGKPRIGREERFVPAEESGERLAKKLERLAVSLDEEEQMTLLGVTTRARAALNVERVTKKFYERFRKEHEAFLKLISGIDDEEQRSWYASLMLNRLMFAYFIQHKGFLDGDKDYLKKRLALMQAEHGEDKFYSFYRFFLLRLFHDGLGRHERSPALEKLLGKVPYLNGGLFDVHQLEAGAKGKAIEIPDKAFARIFKFFDEYDWLLDDRPLRDEREINPDMLGYIFEKYINQKQMGAYYTKEDITEYISKNTIIPFLFDRAQKLCANAFDRREGVWRLLREQPDRYIYDVVRKGVIDEQGEVVPLPAEIAAGARDVSKRGRWNTAAGEEYALPTETWREYAARRERCLELRAKLQRGEVANISDLVTLNLDIRQFAQDVLATYEGSDLIAAFYRAIAGRVPEKSNEEFEQGLSVLDPTAGSGAFLFAALNVLEPLVETCIERMRSFVEEADQAGRTQAHPSFRRVLAELAKHPNAEYFILKSIIINNLYGVDIMEEATEICKLRLFLKLVAQIERDDRRENMGLEPLPDIDFNIRAGNTLVGFVSLAEVKAALSSKLDFSAGETVRQMEEDAHEADRAYKRFRRMQTVYDYKDETQGEFKQQLRSRLDKLADTLDRALAEVYGKDPHKPKEFAAWRKSHQPFHWFTEFYGIVNSNGFDVIIGNPPYISAAKARKLYTLKHYQTVSCSDVYANVLERCQNLLKQDGRSGMIVPLSLTFSGDFDALRALLYKSYSTNWFSSFARIPAALFSAEVRVRNTIHIGHKSNDEHQTLTTVLHRWFEQARPHLFNNLSYAKFSPKPYKGSFPKINTQNFSDALNRCFANTHQTIETALRRQATPYNLYFKKTAYNWLCFCHDLPPCYGADGRPVAHTKFGEIFFFNAEERDLAFLFLNGKIMFDYWCAIGDDFDVTRWMFADFPIDLRSLPPLLREELLPIVDELKEAMQKNVSFKLNAGKKVGNYNLARCRNITDKSDKILARFLELESSWQDIELMYSQVVKTNFSDDEEE